MLAYGLRGNVYRSGDGEEWTSIDSKTERTLNTGHVNDAGEIAIVANDGAVIYSDDGGKSFSSHIRASRHSYIGVQLIPNEGLILTGERGAVRTDRQGRDLMVQTPVGSN